MNWRSLNVAAAVGLSALLGNVSPAFSQTAPPLGTAQNFAVLAAATVTNTGSSVVNGELGVSPGTAVTGFPPGTVTNGTIHSNDAVAIQARADALIAYNNLVTQGCTSTLTGQDLGGMVLTPGVYCFASSAQLTGTLTLNAQGNPAAVFIFKMGSTLTTASNSLVSVINGGQNCNVFWQVGSSATLGTNTTFAGNILAQTSITLTTGARVSGRTLAGNGDITGAVTLDTNTVDRFACAGTACPVIALAPATLPNAVVGITASQTLTASGATAPYTFTVTAGTLPTGLTLTPAGVLSGTLSAAGTFTFTVRAVSASGCFGERSYTVVVAPAGCPAIALSPPTLPNATQGVAFTLTIAGSGGTAPYTFTVTSGTLPAGVTLTSAGVLSGTPTTAGTSSFTIRAVDANGCFVELAYTATVVAAVPTLSQWAMIVLTLLLALAGYAAMRRRTV
jgi:type VI secretion system secreted protein VgrG